MAPETQSNAMVLSLVGGGVAALATVAGGWLVARREWSRRYLRYLLGLGAGFMLAVVFVEVIPEAYELSGSRALMYVLGGYLVVHLFVHTLSQHVHFGEETHVEEVRSGHTAEVALAGLSLHALFDGVMVGAGFLVSAYLGGVLLAAVVLHKLPEGFTAASLMLARGRTRGAAFAAACGLGAATLAGSVFTAFFAGQAGVVLPFSAGLTLYVAASDLVPEVNQERDLGVAGTVFLGAAALAVAHFALHAR
jgi:ZIP family zinc transporter/zinc and cadmium transporter